MFGKWPHEFALGRNDNPGSEIPLSHLLFDQQCVEAYYHEKKLAYKKAQAERRAAGR